MLVDVIGYAICVTLITGIERYIVGTGKRRR